MNNISSKKRGIAAVVLSILIIISFTIVLITSGILGDFQRGNENGPILDNDISIEEESEVQLTPTETEPVYVTPEEIVCNGDKMTNDTLRLSFFCPVTFSMKVEPYYLNPYSFRENITIDPLKIAVYDQEDLNGVEFVKSPFGFDIDLEEFTAVFDDGYSEVTDLNEDKMVLVGNSELVFHKFLVKIGAMRDEGHIDPTGSAHFYRAYNYYMADDTSFGVDIIIRQYVHRYSKVDGIVLQDEDFDEDWDKINPILESLKLDY